MPKHTRSSEKLEERRAKRMCVSLGTLLCIALKDEGFEQNPSIVVPLPASRSEVVAYLYSVLSGL